eukprot:4133706-Amphidinium_carterae.4
MRWKPGRCRFVQVDGHVLLILNACSGQLADDLCGHRPSKRAPSHTSSPPGVGADQHTARRPVGL